MRIKHNSLIPTGYAPSYSFERSAEIVKDSLLGELKNRGEIIPCTDSQPALENGELTASAYRDIAVSDTEKIAHVYEALTNGVYLPDEGTKIKDVMTSQTYPEIFNAAVEIFIRNRIYPNTSISDLLFTKIPYSGSQPNIILRTIGGVQLEEVPEAGLYPEQSTAVRDQAFGIHLTIRKYGAKIGGTAEMLDSDNWGILGATLAQMGKEERMLRESIALQVLNHEAGFVIMDTFDPSNSQLGTPTGRGWGGYQNGALGIDDLFEIYGFMSQRGYNLDTIIIHPFAWLMWQRDPEWRENLMNNSPIFIPNGGPAQGWGSPLGGLGPDYSMYGAGYGSGQTGNPAGPGLGQIGGLAQKLGVGSTYNFPNFAALGSTFYVTPKSAPPFRIITSPLVRFFTITGKTNTRINGKYCTDIIFADSSKCGIWLEKEALTMESWTEFEREIEYFKFRTKFGKALMEQGRGVCIAKNIVIDRTYVYESVHTFSTLPEITRSTAIDSMS